MQMGEFARFITGLDPNMTSEDCRIGFEAIDTDRNGIINFAEFVEWWTSP
jgi:Ca2+-binding EF-hand superfamily protein